MNVTNSAQLLKSDSASTHHFTWRAFCKQTTLPKKGQRGLYETTQLHSLPHMSVSKDLV